MADYYSHVRLRELLKAAKSGGWIRDFALRKAGRATIYLNSGGKVYTTSTLDTLTVLSQEGVNIFLESEKP